MPWRFRGDGLLWARAARTGFEMEAGDFSLQGKVKRKELVLFSALHPFYPEYP